MEKTVRKDQGFVTDSNHHWRRGHLLWGPSVKKVEFGKDEQTHSEDSGELSHFGYPRLHLRQGEAKRKDGKDGARAAFLKWQSPVVGSIPCEGKRREPTRMGGRAIKERHPSWPQKDQDPVGDHSFVFGEAGARPGPGQKDEENGRKEEKETRSRSPRPASPVWQGTTVCTVQSTM